MPRLSRRRPVALPVPGERPATPDAGDASGTKTGSLTPPFRLSTDYDEPPTETGRPADPR